MTQPSLFQSAGLDGYRPAPAAVSRTVTGADAKTAGMARAAKNRSAVLEVARAIAKELAHGGREITADDVVEGLVRRGHSEHCLGNAAGSIFRGRDWEWTGRFDESKRVHAHGNLLRVWRLRTP